jgi:DNA replication protein DnaC
MLDKLYYDLQTYEPVARQIETTTLPDKGQTSMKFLSKLTNIFKASSSSNDFVERPKSLYIYGGAGCGKVFILIFVYVSILIIHTYIHTTESSNGHLLRMYADQ